MKNILRDTIIMLLTDLVMSLFGALVTMYVLGVILSIGAFLIYFDCGLLVTLCFIQYQYGEFITEEDDHAAYSYFVHFVSLKFLQDIRFISKIGRMVERWLDYQNPKSVQ